MLRGIFDRPDHQVVEVAAEREPSLYIKRPKVNLLKLARGSVELDVGWVGTGSDEIEFGLECSTDAVE